MSKIIIQFNEANFDFISKYCKKYHLPNLEKIKFHHIPSNFVKKHCLNFFTSSNFPQFNVIKMTFQIKDIMKL